MNEDLLPMRYLVVAWLMISAIMVVLFWPACKRAWEQIRNQKGPHGKRARRLAIPVGVVGLAGIVLAGTGDQRGSLLMMSVGLGLFGIVFVVWAFVVTAAMKEWNQESQEK